MIKSLFAVPTELHMFHISYREDGGMTLKCELPPYSEEVPFASLFEEVDVSHVAGAAFSPVFSLNIILNRVAQNSRRAVGNIVFVQNDDTKRWFEKSPVPVQRTLRYVVDDSLAENELRATYWVNQGTVIDGGLQYTPNGVIYNPKAKSYFTKCFL